MEVPFLKKHLEKPLDELPLNVYWFSVHSVDQKMFALKFFMSYSSCDLIFVAEHTDKKLNMLKCIKRIALFLQFLEKCCAAAAAPC